MKRVKTILQRGRGSLDALVIALIRKKWYADVGRWNHENFVIPSISKEFCRSNNTRVKTVRDVPLDIHSLTRMHSHIVFDHNHEL